MFTYFVIKLKQIIQTTLESSLSLAKSVLEFVQPEIKEICQVETVNSSSLSSPSNEIITNKRKHMQCINESTLPLTTKRRRMASTPEDSASENVIVSSPSTNKVNKKRKSADLPSFNSFESPKRRYMGSTSEASRKNSRKRKAPHHSDETSFDQDFQACKRHCMDSSFDDSFCDILVIYTDDILSVNKYHTKLSSSIDTLPTDSDDTFATDDDQYSCDDFPIPLCIDADAADSISSITTLTLTYLQCY